MTPRFSKDLIEKFSPGPEVEFSGLWKNELGSEMRLTVKDGDVHGSYRTAVGEAPEEETFDLCGYVKGDLLVFCVNFGAHGSLATWTGQHAVEGGNEEILTLWHLVRAPRDGHEPKDVWSTLLTGANTFTRV